MLISYLKQVDFFKDQDIKDIYYVDIINALKHEKYDKGDYVYKQGINLEDFYAFRHGE